MEKNHDEKVIDLDAKKIREERFKRRAEMIKEIAIDSAITTLEDVRTYQVAAGIGLYQGLKYRGNLGQGLKAGIASIMVFTGCNVVVNIVHEIDNIKNT